MSDDNTEPVKPRRGRHVNWSEDPLILERLTKVEAMHLRGAYNTVIAEELGVDEKTIRTDLKRLRELWVKRAGDAVEDMRAQRYQELEAVKRLALRAFDFDMEALAAVLYDESSDGEPLAGKTIGEHSEADRDSVPKRRRRVFRDSDGRAQYKADKVAALQAYRQATVDQAKLYGLVVDKKDVTSGGQPMTFTIEIDRAADDGDGE